MKCPAPGIHSDVPASVYHQWNAIGSTSVKVLATKTPAHYRYMRDNPRAPSAAMDLGSLVHAMVLEPDTVAAAFVVQPAEIKTRRGKAWDAFVEEHAGRTIVKADAWTAARAMTSNLMDNHAARLLLTSGRREVSFRWDDPETGAACKGRADSLPAGDATVMLPGEDGPEPVPVSECAIDLKTTASADPAEWTSRSMERFGYHIQGGHYLRGLRALGESRQWWVWVCVETSAPYEVAFYGLDRRSLVAGEEQAAFALRRFVACTESGEWPGYGNEIRMVGLSDWAIDAAMMKAGEDIGDDEIKF